MQSYLWRIAYISGRICVVIRQMQSNSIQSSSQSNYSLHCDLVQEMNTITCAIKAWFLGIYTFCITAKEEMPWKYDCRICKHLLCLCAKSWKNIISKFETLMQNLKLDFTEFNFLRSCKMLLYSTQYLLYCYEFYDVLVQLQIVFT